MTGTRQPRIGALTLAGIGLLAGLAASKAWAASPDAGSSSPVLFGLAMLVLLAKVGGLLVERWGQAAVLGELAVGIGLGNLLPPLFGDQGIRFVAGNPTLHLLAEVGVLILLFDVGLEADLRALARVGSSAALVALLGLAAPFALGWGVTTWLLPEAPTLVAVFVGATLTATSVGITARVLKDLGVTRRPEAETILGAAVIDDVLGLVVLAAVTGLVQAASGGPALSIGAVGWIVVKALLFLAITVGLGHWLSGPIVRLVGRTGHGGMLLVAGLTLCFTFALVAEQMGLAAIVGAFAAGLFLDPYGEGVRAPGEDATLNELLGPLSTVFVPLFFVLMGMQVHLGSLADPAALGLGAALVVAAILGKLVSGLGVLGHGASRLAVAVGMIPRGEVGLIFAGIGASLSLDGTPILSQSLYSAVVLMVLVTTLVTPPALRWAFSRRSAG